MQTAKGSNQYKFEHFDVIITPFSEKKLEITVVDPFQKIQFQEKVLTLNNIGVATLMRALQKKLLEVKLGMKVNKTKQNTILEIDVLVASQFLKPVEEVIYLKKSRDISESEILKNSVSLISTKIKAIKDSDKVGANVVRLGTNQQQDKLYNTGANFQPFSSINLKKGKYILTVSFLMKATNTYMYIYFGQGQQLINSCLIYSPSNSQYLPFVIRKLHNVTNNEENITFTTYCNQSYPVSLKNVIVTAQELTV